MQARYLDLMSRCLRSGEGFGVIALRSGTEARRGADAEVTLSFGGGRVSGKSACNRYSADIKQGDSPGDILTGPAMGTRMACPVHLMEIERNYLDSLAHVRSFSFHNGKLALSGQNVDGTQFTMLFSPKMAQHP